MREMTGTIDRPSKDIDNAERFVVIAIGGDCFPTGN